MIGALWHALLLLLEPLAHGVGWVVLVIVLAVVLGIALLYAWRVVDAVLCDLWARLRWGRLDWVERNDEGDPDAIRVTLALQPDRCLWAVRSGIGPRDWHVNARIALLFHPGGRAFVLSHDAIWLLERESGRRRVAQDPDLSTLASMRDGLTAGDEPSR